MPRWVAAVLASTLVSRLARVLLTFMFWSSGLAKLLDWKSGLGDMAHFHLNPPWAFNAATLFVQIAGSVLVIWGRWAWLGAGALAVFTVLTIPIAHAFWTLSGPARMNEMYVALEHVSIVGGLILAAMIARRDSRRG